MLGAEIIFLADLIAIFSIYLIINLSLNLEFGFGGIPNFGKVLCVGAGAFVMGIIPIRLYTLILGIEADPIHDNLQVISQINAHLATHPELGFFVFGVAILVALVVGVILGFVSSYPAIRLRGDYLAMVLFAFGEIIRIVGINQEELVGGTLGVVVPDILSFVPNELRFFMFSMMLLSFAVIVYFLVSRFTGSPVGRLLRAVRDDDVAIQTMGRNITQIKIKTLMIAGMIASLGGLLYASYVEGIVAFGYNSLNWTFLPFVMIMVGGLSNNKGVLFGTLIFVIIRKFIIYYNDSLDGILPFNIIWLDYILLGGIMLIVVMFRPKGIFPESPTVKKTDE